MGKVALVLQRINVHLIRDRFVSQKGTETEHTPERLMSKAIKSNFKKICKWPDEQTQLFKVSESLAKTRPLAGKDVDVYSLKWTKKQFEEY